MKKRTEITIATERLLVISRRKRVVAWCSRCERRVEMLSTDDAALAAGVSSRTIFHWVESGQVHHTETPEGLLLICPDSLLM